MINPLSDPTPLAGPIQTVQRACALAGALAWTLAFPLPAQAGNLDHAAPPANGSGMPSLSGLYQQLSTGTPATVPGAFQEPTAGPNTGPNTGPNAGTGRSLTDLLTLLPVADNVNGAQSAQVLAGKTFWGLSNGPGGQWGTRTGTMPLGSNVTGSNGALSMTLPAGYYDGSKTATAADSNLVAGNIQSGTRIFGVTGTATLATGSATAAQVLSGATFSNSTGNNLTGTLSNQGAPTYTPGTTDQSLTAGYYSGGTVKGDANLLSGNVKNGVTLFGVSGATTVVDTAGATATAADIATGKTAYVNGAVVTGTAGAAANHFLPLSAPGMCAPGWGGSQCATSCPEWLTGLDCHVLIMPVQGTMVSNTDYYASAWDCIYDSTTGLMWEFKAAGTGFGQSDETFSWYNQNSTTNGGNAGVSNGGTCATSGGCDTQHYVSDINTSALCGYRDWRLPTQSELSGLVTMLNTNPTLYIPKKPNGLWSADTDSGNNQQAQGVIGYPPSSLMGAMNKGGKLGIQLVRSVNR